MSIETYTGIAASIFCGVYLLPQLIKIIKTHEAQELSLTMFALLAVGLSLWVVYGIQKKDLLLIISNSFSLAINICTALLSLRYQKKKKRG